MSSSLVTTSIGNGVPPGYRDNPERWMAARITASHINTFLQLILRSPKESLQGEEFESAKHLMVTFQAATGVFIDELHTAITLEQLIKINNEFYSMACAKC
ncbi:hypothetical protein D9M68_18420 [compost metagenome]